MAMTAPTPSPIYRFVESRVTLLQYTTTNHCMTKGTEQHSSFSTKATEAIIGQLNKGTALAPDEALKLIQFIAYADVFTKTDHYRLVESIGSIVDMEAGVATESTDIVTRTEYMHPQKQQMDSIQNYMTADMWEHLAKGSNLNLLLEKVCLLLVSLGLIHPKEKLFGEITAIVQHCYRGCLPPTIELLALVKKVYRGQRSHRLAA